MHDHPLQVKAYVASERPPLGQLYVLRKGMCIKNWRFMRAGRVWGDDLILLMADTDDTRFMDHSQARPRPCTSPFPRPFPTFMPMSMTIGTICHSQAVALTYAEVFAVTREALEASCDAFPEAREILIRAAKKIKFKRAVSPCELKPRLLHAESTHHSAHRPRPPSGGRWCSIIVTM